MKIALVLSAALLPLALIALFATIQTTRLSDVDNHARLRVAAVEASRSLAIELVGDVNALRVAMNALSPDTGNAPACARLAGVFAQQAANGARFAILDRGGDVTCGQPLPVPIQAAGDTTDVAADVVPDRGLLVTVPAQAGGLRAAAFFPEEALDGIAQPSGFVTAFASTLRDGERTLTLQTLENESAFERRDAVTVPIGIDDLRFVMSVRKAPITPSMIVAMLLPILMWLGATVIAWFVVDRLLIRPLRQLRTGMATYRPGTPLAPLSPGPVATEEIAELHDTFHELTRTVERHEASMAEGLVRQTKLTREVHHRVKNNLQVIASLINFHARSAEGQTASDAYAAIQRRVDALAVVHRNHYAEMEENRGLELRSVIGELASNIRATAPGAAAKLGIVVDIEPLLVSQDVAVAVSFLLTEIVELAASVNPRTQVSISVRAVPDSGTAVLRASGPALIESAVLEALVSKRYGRVMLGLSRQLRAPLHHDPLAGAYEITIPARTG